VPRFAPEGVLIQNHLCVSARAADGTKCRSESQFSSPCLHRIVDAGPWPRNAAAKRLYPPQRVDTQKVLTPEGALCSDYVGIPGPDVPRDKGVDTHASTSAACAPEAREQRTSPRPHQADGRHHISVVVTLTWRTFVHRPHVTRAQGPATGNNIQGCATVAQTLSPKDERSEGSRGCPDLTAGAIRR